LHAQLEWPYCGQGNKTRGLQSSDPKVPHRHLRIYFLEPVAYRVLPWGHIFLVFFELSDLERSKQIGSRLNWPGGNTLHIRNHTEITITSCRRLRGHDWRHRTPRLFDRCWGLSTRNLPPPVRKNNRITHPTWLLAVSQNHHVGPT